MRPDARRWLVAAWMLWTLWIAVHYFIVPVPLPDASPHARYRDFVDLLDRDLVPLPFFISALARAVRAVLGASAVLAAGWGCGRVVIRSFDPLFEAELERQVVQLALGLAMLSWVCLLLALAHLYRPVPLRGVVIAAAAYGVWSLLVDRRTRRSEPTSSQESLPRRSGRFEAIVLTCGVVALGFALIGALAPETEYDALWYHLWLPSQWLQAGRPVDRIDEYISLYPLHWELLYGAAMTIGGPIAAKLLHFACLPLAAATVVLLTRRVAPNASAVLAATIAVTTPTFLWEGTTAYIDLALTWYVALAAYAALRFHDSRDRRWLFLCALFLGIAMSIKHLGLVALAIAVVLLTIAQLRTRGRALTVAFAVVAMAMLPALPWYARAFVRSGNPVFPDLYHVFGAQPAGRWDSAAEQSLQHFKDHFGRPRSVATLMTLPWDVTVHGQRYGGTLGPLFLIFVPFALIAPRSSSRGRLWLIAAACALYVAVWTSPFSSDQLRFLMPVVPLLAVLAAAGEEALCRQSSSRLVRTGIAAIVVTLLAMNLPPFVRWHERDRVGWNGWLTHVIRTLPAPVVVGAESDIDYLRRNVRSYGAWAYMGEHLPADVRVLTFEGGDHLYATRDRLSADAVRARAISWGALQGSEGPALRAAANSGITHVLIDKRTDVSQLAIDSERMRTCCLDPVYEDADVTLYRLKVDASPPGAATADVTRSSARP